METCGEMSQETAKTDDSHDKKINNELTSDRESSVESFHTNKSEISTAAETEIIDVDDIELSDEESWLYKSPKKLPNSDKVLNTYKWLQNDPEHMEDNTMLSITKNALVSKLSELQMLNAEKQTAKDIHEKKETFTKVTCTDIDKTLSATESESCSHTASKAQETVEASKKPLEQISASGKENEVLDVVDVHKIAQLQEESLRQSTCRFLTLERGEKKSYDKNNFLVQNPKLSKPASVEALNLCNGKLEENPYNLAPMHKMKRINGYGSSSSLHNTQDGVHRGSLPNINPGYYSLRSKKSKKHIDKMAFPLPICPSRLPLNGAGSYAHAYESQPKLSSPSNDHQSRTLPSSYRIHSRNNSSSRRELNTPSPRRESTSFLPNPRNSPSFSRRESAPCNAPKNTSPLASPTLYQRSHGISSPVLQSPTKSFRQRDLVMSPTEYHRRTASPSPSRRLPLMTMHNRAAPKGGSSPASPRHEELRGFKVQSRIPSPGPVSRSGIPVPSTYMARVNSDEESWSNDCY